MALRRLGKKNVVQKKSFKRVDPLEGLVLPTKPKAPENSFFKYTTLIYGRPGVGKTTFLSSFPDALLYSCERVSQGIRCFDFNAEDGGVHNWEIFLKGVELLQKNKSKFETVCIDTIDAAYNMCMDYVCKTNGLKHPGEANDYGKTWRAVSDEFARAVDAIVTTGRGVVFSSHAKEVEITSHSGEKYTRIQPTMSGQAYAYIKAKSDFVFYAEFIKDIAGNSRRVLITTGDEVVDAKHAGELPQFIPLDKAEGVDLVARAFNGEDVGIPVQEIRPDKNTSKAGTELVRKSRAKETRKKIRK